MSYVLAETKKFPKLNAGLAWRIGDAIEGVVIYARNEKTGAYVRVLESKPDIWVDNEPQSWSTGNFETLAEAQRVASQAYRFLNK